MLLGIDPKVDYAFKHLFGRDSTRPILIDLLNRVLEPAAGHQIKEVELLDPFNPKETTDDKLSVLDIKARDQTGRQFNVEMQMLAGPSYNKRILYYWAKFYQQQLHEGEDYLVLKPTISISFVNQVRFAHTPEYHLRFRLLEDSCRLPFTDDMEFHLLELPKFTKTETELASGLDIWLYFLRYAEMMDRDVPPAALRQPLVLRALEELKMLSQTETERERYEARRKAQLDYNTGMKVARLEGLGEGLTKGEHIGFIHLCEQLLGKPNSPTEQLAELTVEELAHLAGQLRAQLPRT
jgi:predicted transposase/invertase (TIGR01784 family)